jgi:hypothetical protein
MASDDDPSDNATPDNADCDYESVGADIVVSVAREAMQTRVSALRRHLRTAFSAAPGPDARDAAAKRTETDD